MGDDYGDRPAAGIPMVAWQGRWQIRYRGGVVAAIILAVGAFDLLVFRNIDKISKRLNPTTLIISEVVFGILLTALAVELTVSGLASLRIIEGVHH